MQSGVAIQKCPTKAARGSALQAWAHTRRKHNANAKTRLTARPRAKRRQQKYGFVSYTPMSF